MSWFLFKGKKKRSPKRRAKPAHKRRWDPAATYRVLRLGGGVLVLVLLAGGWAAGQRYLRAKVAATRHEPPEVRLINPPVWMPEPVSNELRGVVERSLNADPFDHASLQQAADRLGTSPWISRVHRITRKLGARQIDGRQNGGVVEVIADYRQRAALVRTAKGYHLIDRESVRLPFSYDRKEADESGLPVVQGINAPLPRAGRPWPGEDLAAGLKLAARVARESWARQIKAIDVSNYGGRLNDREAYLKLITAMDNDSDPFNNPGVAWGRAPGEEQFYEPDAAWKLRHIAMEVRENGRIDDRIVRVTTEPGLTRRIEPADTFVNASDRREADE